MCKTMGIYEAKSSFTSLVREAENGYSVTITRHGKPVARIVPASNVEDVLQDEESLRAERRQQAIKELREFRKGRTLAGLTIREMIDEGRR